MGLKIGPSDVLSNNFDLWIVSHGGVASNALCDYLEEKGIKTRPENYGLICHKSHPGTSVDIPILVVYGDYEKSIRSMDRRGFLSANATKMRFGMNLPEIKLERLIHNYPADPLGIKFFLDSFAYAKNENLDNIQFLEYPYREKTLEGVLRDLGLNVDVSSFNLRERKKKWLPISSPVEKIIDIYRDYEFQK